MKINYRLEIEYQVFEKEGKTYFETDNYVFDSPNTYQNRKDVINKYESFQHIFELASSTTNDIILSITEVVNKNMFGFKIPFINIYYSTEDFTPNNTGIILFGGYLDKFKERIGGLVSERKVYKKREVVGFKTDILKDLNGKEYKIIADSPFMEEDYKKLKLI